MISRKSTLLSICRCSSRGRSLNGEFRSSCLFAQSIWGNFIVSLQRVVGLVDVPLNDCGCSSADWMPGERTVCLLQVHLPNIRSSFQPPFALGLACTWLESRNTCPSLEVHAWKSFQTKSSCKSSRSCL